MDFFLLISLFVSSSALLLENPYISSHYFFILCFFGIVALKKRKHLWDLPLKLIWVIYFIGFAMISTHGEMISGFSIFYKPFSTFAKSYLILWTGFYASEYFRINNKAIIGITIVALYGVIVFVFNADPIRELLDPNYDFDYLFGVRKRVASTWSHPIAYGFICSILIVVYLSTFNKSILYNGFLGLLAFNVLVCGSRTDLLCLIIMIGIYLLLSQRGTKRINTIAISVIAVVLIYLLIPQVNSKVNFLFQSLAGIENSEGSSISMRQGQFEESLLYFRMKPIYGGGFDYIQEGLGYGNDIDWKYWVEYENFYGFESYAFILMLERGIVGIVIELILLISIYVWLIAHRKYNRIFFAKAVSILTGFILFAIMTGTLDVWIIAMLFVGIYMGKLYYIRDAREKRNKKKRLNRKKLMKLMDAK